MPRFLSTAPVLAALVIISLSALFIEINRNFMV